MIEKQLYPFECLVKGFPDKPGEEHYDDVHRAFTIEKSKSIEGHGGIQVFGYLGAKLRAMFHREIVHDFDVKGDTTYIFEPTNNYVNQTMTQDNLKDVHLTSKRYFMVSGVKEAHGGTVRHRLATAKGLDAGLLVPTSTAVEVDVGAKIESNAKMNDELDIGKRRFVYAYRLKEFRRNSDGKYYLRPGFVDTQTNLFDADSSTHSSKIDRQIYCQVSPIPISKAVGSATSRILEVPRLSPDFEYATIVSVEEEYVAKHWANLNSWSGGGALMATALIFVVASLIVRKLS